MKKKIFAVVFFALVFFASTVCSVNASDASIEVSVENLVKNPEVFNGVRTTLQGFLVVQQIFAKPTAYYLRDEMNNMIPLKLSKKIDLSKYSKIKATGVFKAGNNGIQMAVDEVTPLEAAPESQPVAGAQNTLVLLGYFSNRLYTKSTVDVNSMIFNDMNAYFTEASYDYMWITGILPLQWMNTGHTVAYYGADSGSDVDINGWMFFRDVVALADPWISFAGYSRFIFVNAGPNQETSGVSTDLWSMRWSGMSIPTGDGVTITHACYVPDIESGGRGVLGVDAHEYGHELGLPDLYTYPSDIHQYDLMDTGSWNNLGNTPAGFTSWCKIQQGWILSAQTHVVPGGGAEYIRLDPLEDPAATTNVIKVQPSSSYYFLVEARRKVGFDAYIPQERVLVLYVNVATNRPYLYASLDVGGQYEYGSFGVRVMSTDGWSYNVYVWHKTWSGDIRLTNAAGPSETFYGHKTVATVGSYVYVTWADGRDGNWEIYFKRSTWYGTGWEADQRLTINTATQAYPCVAAYGSYVYVTWQDYRNGNWEIYFKRNRSYGYPGLEFYWYADQRLTSNSYSSTRPSMAVSGRNVYVVWVDNRDGNNEIYFKRSTDCGVTWGADTRLTSNASSSEFPNVAAVGANVYVSWQDYRNGNWDIYFKRGTSYGATWGADTRLTTNTATQIEASIAAWGYDVYVVWSDYRYGASNTEIFMRRSTTQGSSWLSEYRLTSASYLSGLPVVAAMGSHIYVVWEDNRTGPYEIYFKESPNKGVYWTPDRRLSATPYNSQWPSIAVGGQDWEDVFVAWSDQRNGGPREIYFKYRY